MISPRHLEGLARSFRDITGVAAPIDAFVLAELAGLVTKPWAKAYAQIDLDRDVIFYPVKARIERVHFKVLHELSHWWLRENGESDRDEGDVDQLASMLLLPREEFLRDLAATDWDLFDLKLRHPHASYQAIVGRMCALSPATASVWDHGRLHRVYGEHDVEEARRVVDLALELEEPIEVGNVRAFPVLDGAWRRVLVVRRAA